MILSIVKTDIIIDIESPSAELLALAKQVVQQQQVRRQDDIQAWAERLAQDVGNAVD